MSFGKNSRKQANVVKYKERSNFLDIFAARGQAKVETLNFEYFYVSINCKRLNHTE